MFWHEYAKIPRGARKNPIAEGDFCWIFARNCEDTEQLRLILVRGKNMIENKSAAIMAEITKAVIGKNDIVEKILMAVLAG